METEHREPPLDTAGPEVGSGRVAMRSGTLRSDGGVQVRVRPAGQRR